MMPYNDIFLAKELDKALTDVLIKTHNFFRKYPKGIYDEKLKDVGVEKELQQIYESILKCPILTDKNNSGNGNLVWFNAWRRKHTEKAALYFIGASDDPAKNIIKLFINIESEHGKYVSSLSELGTAYKNKDLTAQNDYAFIITHNRPSDYDIMMSSVSMHDFFIHLDLTGIKKIILPSAVNVNNCSDLRNNIDKVQEALKDNFAHIKKNADNNGTKKFIINLTKQLGRAWGIPELISYNGSATEFSTVFTKANQNMKKDDHINNIVRLINYWYWTKLAYPDGETILYLPGIVAKGFEGIPLGVNIGLKKDVPLDVLLFLKRAVLLFFTRQAVDYYEEKVRRETIKHGTNAAKSAIMSRNQSHNIGSHVLATLTVKEYIKDNPQSVINFYSYLQKRMDLIARMVGGQDASGEPMYFVGDLLNGFFKQTLLLNHFIKDQGGFEKTKIIFKVCLPGVPPVCFTYTRIEDNDCTDKNNDDCMRWLPENNAKINDFLVSIPDGEIGCQAFYVFLESMMRNSAKYGLNNEENEFQITIKVKEENEFYKISICDNLSLCQDKKDYKKNVVAEIMNRIEEPLINNNGELSAKYLGIAEMKAACEFLIMPFDYPAHTTKDGKKYPLWVECPGPDDCHKEITANDLECEKGPCCNHLTYIFHLMNPQMVAVVGSKDDVKDNANYGIKIFDNLTDLTKPENSYQFVVVYLTDENKKEILNTLQEKHHALPFRILIVNGNFDGMNKIPKRRVTFCTAEEICSKDTQVDTCAENFIVSVYEAWIRNRWLNMQNGCFNLVLAFKRDGEHSIFARYKKIESIAPLCDKIKWSVYRTYNASADSKFGFDIQQINNDYNYLIYDNHAAFKAAKNISESYFHHLTGEENNKIFEMLASPPANDFSFRYFLLSVLEASLTEVVIIDERVAEACINKNRCDSYNINHLRNLNHCRCYPVFKIFQTPLNKAVQDKMKLTSHSNTKTLNELTSKENNGQYSVGNADSLKISNADHVIIHYGLIETHEALKEEEFKKLYSLAPSIVITSGRGAGTIKKGNDDTNKLPFLEASILKDNTYPSISKYHLVRALMSIKGEA